MGRHKYRRGDVVIVPVLYATPPGSKVRPAMIVSSDAYHAAQPANVIIARISGNIAMHQTTTDYILQDWREAGLRRQSVVTSFLITVSPSDIRYIIGRLSVSDLKGVEKKLRLSLDLP